MKNSFILLICLTASALHAQVTIVKSPLYMYNYVTTLNDKLLFFATDALDYNYELWTSDGTEAGTQQLKDINPGTEGSIPDQSYWGAQYKDRSPVIYNGELYFLAYEPAHGMEVWKTDGTPGGTQILKDIHPGTEGYFSPEFNYPYFTELDGMLYFAANDGAHGFELWKTDGSEAGTSMVKDISTDAIYGSNPEHLIAFNGKLYFTARDDVYGYELYSSDGTSGGTEIVKNIVPGISGSMNDGYAGSIDPQFTVSGDYLYFTARIDDELPVTFYLYRTDGTDAGTITLNNTLQNITDLTNVDGNCFFYAFDGDYDHSGLWKTDGTPGGTVNINAPDIFAYTDFYNFNNTLFFFGGNTSLSEVGLYKSNGSAAGTSVVTTFEGLGSFPEIGDYIPYTGSGTFFYRALFKITESSMDWRYVQTTGTPSEMKIFWDASPFRGSAFLDSRLYFPGIDTMADQWALYSITPLETLLGVADPAEKEMTIYPNPASGSATIILKDNSEHALLRVFDAQGKKLTEESITGSAQPYILDTGEWNDGVYVISVLNDMHIYTARLIITHN